MPKGHRNSGGYLGHRGSYIRGGKFSTSDAYSADVWGIVTSGLTLYLDAANINSYPGSGTTWYDLSGNNYHFTIQANAFNYAGPASFMNFEGSFGMAKRSVNGAFSDVPAVANGTVLAFSSILNSTTDWRTLLRGNSTGTDHNVIIEQGSNRLGMYDNGSGTYQDSGYVVTNITNGFTRLNMLTWRLSQSSPYYQFSFNGGSVLGSNTNILSSFNSGFATIGGYAGEVINPLIGNQYWGRIGAILYYNRTLTDAEITQNLSAIRARYNV
jgi:hypothetical protein